MHKTSYDGDGALSLSATVATPPIISVYPFRDTKRFAAVEFAKLIADYVGNVQSISRGRNPRESIN